jgi:uncharacterized BrkB/YihY/UPF0761 family membrane protein
MDLAALLGRFLDRPGVVEVRAVFDVYGRAPGTLLANGLAFAALFTTIPLALVTLGVAGWLINDPALQAQVAAAIGRLVPPLAGFVDQALVAVSEGAALTSLVGVAGLAWTLSQFYATLDIAFSRIFTGDPARGLFGRTARGFVVVAGLIAVIVALIVVGSLAAAAEAFLPASASALTAVGEIVSSFPVVAAVGVVAVMVVYRVEPVVPVPGAAARGGRSRGRIARDGVRGARLAVGDVPGAAAGRRVGPGARREPGRDGGISPAGCRSAGRTGRWRRVTGRS